MGEGYGILANGELLEFCLSEHFILKTSGNNWQKKKYGTLVRSFNTSFCAKQGCGIPPPPPGGVPREWPLGGGGWGVLKGKKMGNVKDPGI
jgi:hypothetical protein